MRCTRPRARSSKLESLSEKLFRPPAASGLGQGDKLLPATSAKGTPMNSRIMVHDVRAGR